MPAPRALILDFETTSKADLRKVGAWKYAANPSTEVLMVGCGFSNESTVEVLDFYRDPPKEIRDWISAGNRVVAHNAQFEMAVWSSQLAPRRTTWPFPRLWYDTMIASAYFGGPMSLDLAGQAWGLNHVKDAAGHRIMLDFAAGRATPWAHPEKYQKLVEYCRADVATEKELYNLLPQLPNQIQQEWLLDQTINQRGLPIDLERVRQLANLAAVAKPKLADLAKQEYGVSLSSPAQILAYYRKLGFEVESLTKDKIEDFLEVLLLTGDDHSAYLLELRKQYAKTSAAKLTRMLNCAQTQGVRFPVIRGAFQYYGAARTGRWAGRLVQPQNFPRPPKDFRLIDAVLEDTKAAAPEDLHHTLEDIFGINPLTAVSAALRSCIAVPPPFALVRFDFAQIEARVLAWLARQNDVLQIFATGQDVYVHAANKIPGTDRMQPDLARQLGKVATLGLGFGLGKDKFVELCAVQKPKIEIDVQRAEEIVTAWRVANFNIVAFWQSCANVFRAAIKNPAQRYSLGYCTVYADNVGGVDCVVIELPSGRRLFYHKPSIRQGKWPDGSPKDELCYYGLDQYTNKWTVITTYGGKLAENITQAVARDVMSEAMIRATAAGYHLVGTVHDELIFLGTNSTDLGALLKLIETPPVWCVGLPIKAEGAVGQRYGK